MLQYLIEMSDRVNALPAQQMREQVVTAVNLVIGDEYKLVLSGGTCYVYQRVSQ